MTTPVLGAIVRYKIIALPFLIFLVVSACDIKILQQRWRLLNDEV
jgi:hypothetical protein